MIRARLVGIAALGILLATGCSVQVDKSKDGLDKNVKVDTPLGGLHVRADDTSASDVGLPVYPGAKVAPGKDGHKSADVHIGFGEWQFRLKVVSYETDDSQDKVVAFYQKALGRYGDVIQCRGDQPVGTPTATHEGLTCSEDKSSAKVKVDEDMTISLKAGSKRHQHIFGIEKNSEPGTRFALVELQLPAGAVDEKSDASN